MFLQDPVVKYDPYTGYIVFSITGAAEVDT